jgi:hypothetical protein
VDDDELAARLLDHAERLEASSWGTVPVGFIRLAARRLVELSPQDVNRDAQALVTAHEQAQRTVGRPRQFH